jgi:MFS family permease
MVTIRPRVVFAIWALFLALAAAVEWAIFTHRTPNYYLLVVQPAFAIVGTLAIALLAGSRRDRTSRERPTVIADLSMASALVGVAVGTMLWGAFIGEWLLLIGAGMLALGLGGITRELVSARRLARAAARLVPDESEKRWPE